MSALTELRNNLKEKYNLTDFGFDAECIYQLGDLSSLLGEILRDAFPEMSFDIAEKISEDGKKYIATVSYGGKNLELDADTHSDWLPETFYDTFSSIPAVFNTGKIFLNINPILLGQDAWYFCGTEENLKKARAEGLPLVYPGEDIFAAKEYEKFV